jgi:hypothetical protein
VRRNHLAKDDLDWLPERYRLLRGAVVASVWSAIGGSLVALMVSGAHVVVFGKLFVVLGAAGYWVGDRAAKGLIGARLGKLARGQVDLARLSNQEDGELLHVRGTVRAERTIPGMLAYQGAASNGVYRRTRVSFGEVQVIDEEAVDFQLVDKEGNAIAIETDNARLLVHDPKLASWSQPDKLFPLAQPEAAARVVMRYDQALSRGRRRGLPAIQAGEIMLRPGDVVEAVGYKSRKVDPTVAERLARETPMRATLRGGKDLPVILSLVGRAGAA